MFRTLRILYYDFSKNVVGGSGGHWRSMIPFRWLFGVILGHFDFWYQNHLRKFGWSGGAHFLNDFPYGFRASQAALFKDPFEVADLIAGNLAPRYRKTLW